MGCSHRLQTTEEMPPTEKVSLPVAEKERSLNLKGVQYGATLDYSPQEDEDYVVELYYNKNITINGVNTEGLTHSFKKSNEAIKLYNRSQYYVYQKNYDSAIYFVNQSLEQIETSEALALKGSILFLKGLTHDAKQYWEKAIKMDSTIIFPSIH